MIEPGVIEAVEQVDRAGPGRGHAHADLPGELRVRARRERGQLLMTSLDEPRSIDLVKRPEQAVDAIARVAIDALDPPLGEAAEDELCRGRGHAGAPVRCSLSAYPANALYRGFSQPFDPLVAG